MPLFIFAHNFFKKMRVYIFRIVHRPPKKCGQQSTRNFNTN